MIELPGRQFLINFVCKNQSDYDKLHFDKEPLSILNLSDYNFRLCIREKKKKFHFKQNHLYFWINATNGKFIEIIPNHDDIVFLNNTGYHFDIRCDSWFEFEDGEFDKYIEGKTL